MYDINPTYSFRTRMEKSTTVYAKAPGMKATAELVIKDFLEVMKTSQPGKSYASDTFMVGDAPMAIEVFPNGDIDEYKGYVGVFLDNLGDAHVNVKCQFVAEAKTISFDRLLKEQNGIYGTAKFLSHAECNEFYKEKDFVLTAHVEIPGEDLKIMGNEDAVVPKKFDFRESLFSKMTDSNFKLVFQGTEVACHKHILAAASPVFEAMVENEHKEGIEGRVGNI